MLKNKNKSAFTLLETIFALTIISIMIGGFTYLYTQKVSYDRYNELQVAENEFLTDSSKLVYQSETIKLVRKKVQ